MHHGLEAIDRAGIYTQREHRTPERILGWIDDTFGGTWSSEANAGASWYASDAAGLAGFCSYAPHGLRYAWLRDWQQRPAVGIFGPLGVAERARGRGLGRALLHAGMFGLRERGYRQALVPAVSPELVPFYERNANARVVEDADVERRGKRRRVTVLASGNGGNFEAVARAAAAGELPLDVTSVVANRAEAPVLARAARLGIASHAVVRERGVESREEYDARVIAAVAAKEPELVLLLGWMHVLPATFVARFPETLNLHPALLPFDPAADRVTAPDGSEIAAYRGAHAFADALDAASPWAGATVHRLSVAIDRGEIFARLPMRLARDAGRETLEEELHALEARVVATAIRRWTWERP